MKAVSFWQAIRKIISGRCRFSVVAGGKERQDSVANALAAVEETDCYIAVHDGARPLRDALFLNAHWLPLRCMAPQLLPFR